MKEIIQGQKQRKEINTKIAEDEEFVKYLKDMFSAYYRKGSSVILKLDFLRQIFFREHIKVSIDALQINNNIIRKLKKSSEIIRIYYYLRITRKECWMILMILYTWN